MKRGVVLTGALLMAAFVTIGFVLVGGGSARQPLEFSHREHVEDVGAMCMDCHIYAESGMRATIPNIEICAYCHSDALTESEVEAELLGHIESEELIPWQKVNVMPDHVFFSHRRHTTVAGIECVTCHGSVEEEDEALSRPLIKITMNRCIRCHEEYEASNDCIFCHR